MSAATSGVAVIPALRWVKRPKGGGRADEKQNHREKRHDRRRASNGNSHQPSRHAPFL